MNEPYLFKLDKNSVGSRHRFFKMVRLYYLYWYIAENECVRRKTRIRFTAASNSIHDLIKKHLRKNYPLCVKWFPERLGNLKSYNLHHNIDLCFLITLEMKDE